MDSNIRVIAGNSQANRSLSQKIAGSTKAGKSSALPKASCAALTLAVTTLNSQLTTLNSWPTILRSAFQPPQKLVGTERWSHNPKTVECNFKWITANFISQGPLSGQVSTEVSTKREVITVASASEFGKAGDTGFIGEGFTKCGIYVCLIFSYFTSTWHLICKLQGQVWRLRICRDISDWLNNDQRKCEDRSWSQIQASLPMWLIQSSIQ